MFIGIGVAIAVRAVGTARAMRFRMPPQAPALPDPRVDQLTAEVEDLRTQVERLSAAEHFYAQLGTGQRADASPAGMPGAMPAQVPRAGSVPGSAGGAPGGGMSGDGTSMGGMGPGGG